MTDESPAKVGSLALAMSKAQGMIEGAKKDTENPFFKSKYADLASCWDACRDALSKNEISVIQKVSGNQQSVTVTTILAHSSGEREECDLSFTPAKPDVQAMGSVITYLRRYSLCAMVGIAPEDDDGNSAPKGVDKPVPTVTSEQAKKAIKEASKPSGIWLALPGGEGETHGTAGAFLDAIEGHLSKADDPNALFDANMPTLQQIQAKAHKLKDEGMVGRIKAIFDHVAAGDIPGASA